VNTANPNSPPAGNNYVRVVLDRLTSVSPGLDPELARLYALLVLVKGEATTLRDVHDAGSVWRDRTRPSLIPFEQLSRVVQLLDRPYATAIHKAGRAVRR
jgi:hypothetical protein